MSLFACVPSAVLRCRVSMKRLLHSREVETLRKMTRTRSTITLLCWCLWVAVCCINPSKCHVTVPGCGRSLDALERIVGGEPVREGFLPWMVTLHQKMDKNFEHICGGSILNERWILTAAHCLQSPDEPHQYEVYVGLHHLSKKSAQRVQRHSIAQFVVHSAYNPETMQNDIALAETSRPMKLGGAANGVCLPKPGQMTPPKGVAVVAGWGHTKEGGELSDVLRKVHLSLMPRKYCHRAYTSEKCRIHAHITKNMICAGSVGLDSCQADSGGPLVMWQKGRAYQFGIVSFGDGCGRPGFPGVYTRVASYVRWIERIVHDHHRSEAWY